MFEEVVSPVEQVIDPPSAVAVLVEEAGRVAQNLWWDDRDASLWWTDVEGDRVHRLNLQTQIQSVVYEGPTVGAFIPQEDGTWLLFREKDIAVLDFGGHPQVTSLFENVRVDGDRFNGALADASGRVLLATLRGGRPNGAGIYRLETTGTLAKLLGGTGAVNGLAWTEKGDALYWACGTTKTICRCRYEVKRGALTNRQVFHECLPDEGTPAGLAIDREGTIWSARRDGAAILKIAADRRLMGQVTIPGRHVTSIAFGGADLRTVFVAAVVEEGRSKIFTLQAGIGGVPLARSRIERTKT